VSLDWDLEAHMSLNPRMLADHCPVRTEVTFGCVDEGLTPMPEQLGAQLLVPGGGLLRAGNQFSFRGW